MDWGQPGAAEGENSNLKIEKLVNVNEFNNSPMILPLGSWSNRDSDRKQRDFFGNSISKKGLTIQLREFQVSVQIQDESHGKHTLSKSTDNSWSAF